mgnify:CR=1 FL=1
MIARLSLVVRCLLLLTGLAAPGWLGGAQILRIGNGTEPQDLDPQAVTGTPEHKIIMGLFEGLLTEDPQDLHPVPGVAEAWDISPDGKVYTFHLRANAQWSDGTPLTADDFVQSYRRMLSPALASEYAYLLFNFVAGAHEYYQGKITDFAQVGFQAVDARTLRVTLKQPTPFLLNLIASHYAWDVVPVAVIARYTARPTRKARPGPAPAGSSAPAPLS